jgi:hypothetical protein
VNLEKLAIEYREREGPL